MYSGQMSVESFLSSDVRAFRRKPQASDSIDEAEKEQILSFLLCVPLLPLSLPSFPHPHALQQVHVRVIMYVLNLGPRNRDETMLVRLKDESDISLTCI